MHSTDFYAIVYDSAVYCDDADCLPEGITSESEDASPIFADSEWDSYPMCDHCHAEHDYVSLTSDGQAWLEQREYGEPFAQFFKAYLECAVWSSTDIHPDDRKPDPRELAADDDESEEEPERDPEPKPLEDFGFSADDIAPEAVEYLKEDARSFWSEHREILKENPSQAGHDFWLSRNGHGAGFFDGPWGENCQPLQKAAKMYGEENLTITEDGSQLETL